MACFDEKQAAINFANTFCNLLDKHRSRLCLYLADDAVLDWFGRTIQGREAITGFINLEVPQTVHTLTSIEPSGPIQHRRSPGEPMDEDGNNVVLISKEKSLNDSLSDDDLAKPLANPNPSLEEDKSGDDILSELNLSNLSFKENGKDKKTDDVQSWESQFTTPMSCEISEDYKNIAYEAGQGDCFPKSHVSTLKEANKFLEARGSIQFQRCKQSKMLPKNMKLVSDTMKWDRFCKLQIAYSTSGTGFHKNDSGDGLDNDFKIWLLVYQDNTRCRRNLLGAFHQVS